MSIIPLSHGSRSYTTFLVVVGNNTLSFSSAVATTPLNKNSAVSMSSAVLSAIWTANISADSPPLAKILKGVNQWPREICMMGKTGV